MKKQMDRSCTPREEVRNLQLNEVQMAELISEQKAYISEMQQSCACAEMAYMKLYQKYARVVHEKNNLQNEVQRARQERDALMNSWSMRITAPMRKLMWVLRRWKANERYYT